MKMNPRVKGKWVRSLRSGEYRQDTGELVREAAEGRFGYCCLGVLAAEMAPEFLVFSGVQPGGIMVRGEAWCGTIPDDLAVMWGLDEDAQDVLVGLNDRGTTFKRIAAWIDRNL